MYRVQPEPIDDASTTWVDAGPLRFGVEARLVTPESLREAYGDDAAALAEIEANAPEEGFADAGLSVHVVGVEDGHEYLRFDAFADDPHYHYIRPSGDHNHWVPFDSVAGGDMVAFTLACLRERLPEMLVSAGGESLAQQLDVDALAPAVDALERRLDEIRAADRHDAAER